jgi:hypothetical protein
VSAPDFDRATARMLGWSGWPDTADVRYRLRDARAAVRWARELESDVLERGLDAPWVADALARGDSPQPEQWIAEHWCGALVAFLRLMEKVS